MKTTVEISDSLLAEAKALALTEKTSLRSLIEEGLRSVILSKKKLTPRVMRDGRFRGEGLTEEMKARGGWAKLREAAYPGFFDDDDEDEESGEQ